MDCETVSGALSVQTYGPAHVIRAVDVNRRVLPQCTTAAELGGR
jgi:hypothetical protein